MGLIKTLLGNPSLGENPSQGKSTLYWYFSTSIIVNL